MKQEEVDLYKKVAEGSDLRELIVMTKEYKKLIDLEITYYRETLSKITLVTSCPKARDLANRAVKRFEKS